MVGGPAFGQIAKLSKNSANSSKPPSSDIVIWKIVRRSGVDTLEYVLWPTNLAVFALGVFKFWQSARRARAKHVCAIMLRNLRCPRCGYDIRGLPADTEDGATICPECGCAWMLDDDRGGGVRGDD